MKRRLLGWGAVLLALVLVGLALGRTMQARHTEPPASTAPAAPVALELAPADIARAALRELRRQVDITGELRAVDSAVVRAKVAGELQQLSVREGDRVTAGQVLGRIDATEYALRLRQAEQQSAQARAQLEIAERALENNRALVDQGFISRNALDTSVSNAAAARAGLQAADAAAALARKAQADTVLRAPIDGEVAERPVQPGGRVAVDAQLISIVDLSRIELEATLPPEQVATLPLGAEARLRVDGQDEPVPARVARINPVAQPGTRALRVYLAVEPRPGLRQGLFATGRIELERARTLTVPADAVRTEAGTHRVLAVQDGRVVAQSVRLGRRGEAEADDTGAREPLVEVLDGLAEGDVVLRASIGLLRDGTAVQLPGTPPAAVAAQPAPAVTR